MTEEQISRQAAEYNRCRKLHDRMKKVSSTDYRRMMARKDQMNFCTKTMNRIKSRFAEDGIDVTFTASGLIARIEY